MLGTVTLWSQSTATADSVAKAGSKSLAYYESVLKKHPQLAEARFGAGHAAYVAEDYERALSEFKAVAEADKTDLQSESYYNLGNTLHQQGQLEESLAAFRQALKLNPSDLDAKYNYEFTKRLMEQMQQKQNQDQSEKGQEGDGDEGEQRQQQEQREEDQDEEGQSQAEDESGQNQPKPSESRQQEESGAEHRKRPDAESILDALKADEENMMKRRLSQTKSKKREKDW